MLDISNNPDLKLLSLPQVAEVLGITHRTAWQYIHDKKLHAVKIGGKWKVTERNLAKFVNGEPTAPAVEKPKRPRRPKA